LGGSRPPNRRTPPTRQRLASVTFRRRADRRADQTSTVGKPRR